ncbi:zincin-like metallopeptidase toxin domain-containing protein [Tenacibaculum halocynthiae]|uniref:zincin-like metallopeptidase toxin domain-containing protein n=1 Tax=Tenacibaculum halocynthiae TaxID=1254437 RepID=UPI0038B49195
MNTITTITDLIKFLKVGTSNGKTNQEVLVKKITRDATYEESTQSFRDFGSQHKEVNIPQTIYLNKDNNAFLKQQYTTGVFYKPITYQKDLVLYPEKDIKEYVKEFNIPEELYNGGYSFYVNQEDTLVTSIQITTLNNLSNYAAYQASAFSYLKSYSNVPYKYTSVYGNSIADTIKVVPNTESELIHKFPVITKSIGTCFSYCLSYYYKKDSAEIRSIPPAEEDYQFIGLRIYCKDITTVLQFLNETIFSYYNEYTDFQSKWRNLFLIKLIEKIAPAYNNSKLHNKAAIVYHLAQPLYYKFNTDSLWNLLEGLAKGYIRNYLSINEEDLIIKTLRILYFRYTHRQKTKTIDGSKILEKKDIGSIEINDLFIENLLIRRADKKILLYKLIDGLNGEHFQTYVYFIWNIWKSSSYADINPKTNKLVVITDKTPVLLAYQSKKILGFHSDNATINWKGNQPLIDISVSVKTGRFEEKTIEREDGDQKIIVEKQEKHQYSYHPFSPLVLQNGKNPAFLLKDKDQKEGVRFTKLPAFLLYANDQKAFWENVLTGVEYGVDILTTVSGVGNLIKVGRLVKLLKNGKTLLYKTKQVTTAIAATKAVAGAIEVSSGVVNTLLNLTSIDDTELGKSISKYLFYLETIALTGEVSVFLKGKLQKTAKEIVENSKFTMSLDDLVKKGEIDEIEKRKIFDEMHGFSQSSFLKKVSGRGRRLGQKLTKSDFRKIKKFLKNHKVELEIHPKESSNIIEGFFLQNGKKAKMPTNAAAIFITDGEKMKIVLREQATVYEFFHEFMHYRHSQDIGLKEFLKLGGRDTYGEFIKEHWVYNILLKHKEYLTKSELKHALEYINETVRYKFGKEPLDFEFDIEKIPDIRKEIKVGEIFKIK